jgi:hypothetical protein
VEPNDVRLEKRAREFPERRARLSFASFVLFACLRVRVFAYSFIWKFIWKGMRSGDDDRSSVYGRVAAFAKEKERNRDEEKKAV